MMIRSFLPVGQGAFYCEKFKCANNENINVVYDCGSLTDPKAKFVEQEIIDNFKQYEVIHALFISHLDKDHVNGIPFLLKHCKVKNIFFPIISAKDKTLMEIYLETIDKNGFAYNFLTNPIAAVGGDISLEETTIYGVRYSNNFPNEEEYIVPEGVETIISGENVKDIIFREALFDGENYSKELNEWQYIPFNFRQKERLNQLYKALNSEFQKNISDDELVNLWRTGSADDREKIKNAYKSVSGKLNTNSLVLFSGIKDTNIFQCIDFNKYYCYDCEHCVRFSRKKSGCLYTGDYDAKGAQKWNELRKAYNSYWEHIGCVQIPHHGSWRNFNDEFLDKDSYFIISAGSKSRNHPSCSVIKKLLFNKKIPYIVNEFFESKVDIIVNI